MNESVNKYIQCSTETTGNANSILYTQRGNNYRGNNFRDSYRGRGNNRANYQHNGYYQYNCYNQNNGYNRNYNNTSLQKKIDEIRLSGNLCFPVRYISLIQKRALKIFSMVPFFFKRKKRFSHFFVF